MEQALLERVQTLHQESESLEERMTFVDKQVEELTDFLGHLRVLELSKDSSFFSSLGKGVFVESQLRSKRLLIDVGTGVLVKKEIPEVQEIIRGQLEGLRVMRNETQTALERLHTEFEEIIARVEGMKDIETRKTI